MFPVGTERQGEVSGQKVENRWTSEQDATIKTMKTDRVQWKVIAAAVGRSEEACCSRYRSLVPKEVRSSQFNVKKWTAEEETTLYRMKAEKKSLKEIAVALGRTYSQVGSKIHYEERQTEQPIHLQRDPRVWAPPERLVDRDRRLNAEMDLTAEFFGDPRPGQSALDKRQGIFA